MARLHKDPILRTRWLSDVDTCSQNFSVSLRNRLFMIKYLTLFPIETGIPRGSVLEPLLFTIYTADLPTLTEIATATFADDTALLASHWDPIIASSTLQRGLDSMERWVYKWRFKINENKSSHITFMLRKQSYPQVTINNIPIVNKDTVMGMILDRRMTWKGHVVDKSKELKKTLLAHWQTVQLKRAE